MTAPPAVGTEAPTPLGSGGSESPALGLLGATVAVTVWGSASILAKVITLGAVAIGAYRFSIYAIAMLLFLAVRRTPFTWRAFKASAAGGIALGVDIALFFSAVKLTTVVDATVIGAMQPVVLMAFAGPLFGERVRLRDAGLAAVAIAGVIVVVTGSSQSPEWSLAGDLLAVGAVLAWAAYFVFSKRSKGVISSAEYTAGTGIWAALISVALALVLGQDLSWPGRVDWFWLMVMAMAAGVLGHSLMNWSLVRIPLWVGSVLTLLIPVASSLLAWLVLDESLNVRQILAIVVVLGCLLLIITGQSSAKADAVAPVQPVTQ